VRDDGETTLSPWQPGEAKDAAEVIDRFRKSN
jgi:hypothetical protein